jgi:hypothetical protein
MGDLSEHFSKSEFACKCGCGADAVSPNLLDALERMRAGLNARRASGTGEMGGYATLPIRSGCRCPTHNVGEGGKPDSAHLATRRDAERVEECEAADLAAATSRSRYQFIRAAVEAGFKRIGIGRDFVHVDVDPVKDQEVLWLY